MVNEGEHHFGYRLCLWQLKPAPAEQLDVWKIAGGVRAPTGLHYKTKKINSKVKGNFC